MHRVLEAVVLGVQEVAPFLEARGVVGAHRQLQHLPGLERLREIIERPQLAASQVQPFAMELTVSLGRTR